MQINGPVTANAGMGSNSYGYYYSPNNAWSVQLTLPLAAQCSANMGSMLWAIADINDTATNAKVNTANTVFYYSYANYYLGQLVFTLPSSVVEHPLHFSISLFNNYSNGQYSSFIGTYSGTVTIHANSYYYYYYYVPRGQFTFYYNGYVYSCYAHSPYNYYNGTVYYCYPYYSYYPFTYPGHASSCYNGEMVMYYYDGAYYYASC